MKNMIIGLMFLFSPFLMWSHNPLSASYYFEVSENASLLSISLSQDAINKVLLTTYTKAELEEMNQKNFEELIVKYIKSHFKVILDDVAVELKKGGIKLGSHQTDLKFVLPPYAQDIDEIVVDIPAFKENGKHQTIFSYNINGKTNKVILSELNNYKVTIELNEKEAIIKNHQLWNYSGIAILLVITLLFFRKRLTKEK
ncbi:MULTISPECIES: hypothetical protein [Nonlabens]|uniref:hypothetical protein n=1 Tax=Nonlabens TaxID=363408 RepID=UPI003264CCB3